MTPGFPVGAVRLWDSRTRWAELEPERGRFAWSTLERLIAGAGRARLPVLLTLGGTPAWASPGGPLGPYDDGSRAAPPDRLTDWDGLVRALVDRYRGRITAYELWVMGNDPHYYNGRVETLVEMTRRASRIIKGADARATVVCPSMAYFYSWGNAHLPITLQADGGAPTAAANGVARLQQWLRDARITSCGRGVAIGVPANVWRCRFTAPGETRTVYWTDTGSARVGVGPGVRGLDRLEGGGATGDVLTVTQSPVLVRTS